MTYNIKYVLSFAVALVAIGCLSIETQAQKKGWIKLFDGKSLEGWQVGEHAETFKVEDGAIVVFGPRAHLFYMGPVENHSFKNFEYKAILLPEIACGYTFRSSRRVWS